MTMLLSKGGQGIVYHHGQSKVYKVIPKSVMAYKEINITRRLQGIEGIVRLYDVLEDNSNCYMIMKKYEEPGSINLITYYRRVLEILSVVHKNDIIHNDIKPENIMLDEGDPVIIDFGNSMVASQDNKLSYTTPLYCSLESLSSKMTFKSDIWSVGVMMYYDMTGKFPFDGSTPFDIFRAILGKSIDWEEIKDPMAQDLIKHLLEKNLDKRYDANMALKHPWFLQKVY